jgi:hypothetical protein
VVAHPHPMYNPPKGGLGHRVVSTMAKEFEGVREQRWNSERPLIFAPCILRKCRGVIRAANIRRRVECRLQMWTDGQYDALVQDIVGEAMGVQAADGSMKTRKSLHASTIRWYSTESSALLSAMLLTAVAVES